MSIVGVRKKTRQHCGENVKTRQPQQSKKQALSPRLNRTTFCTSREMDFFSAKELVTQTGHEVEEWPLVILKELIDNALDACEEAGTPPEITVTADAAGISVADNGPGLPESTLKAALDFTIRASNREAYVAPDRGAQGNALKTLLPMPRVLDPDHGRFIVRTNGKQHSITCGADAISQRAVVNDDCVEIPKCKNPRSSNSEKACFIGTEIRLEWEPDKNFGIWPFVDSYHGSRIDPNDGIFAQRFSSMVEGFALFNPHATFRLHWFDQPVTVWKATAPAWEKWLPCKPTSAHWYEVRHLERLTGAYITHDRDTGADRLASDLIAEFDGLTGSQKRSKVLEDANLHRVKLSEFVAGDRLDTGRIQKLLSAMQKHTRPVNPRRLGIIGEDHLRSRLLAMGIQPESFRYSRKFSKSGLPWVLESAFGYRGPGDDIGRKIYSGANWSASIKNPFRSFGSTGEGLESKLAEFRATRREPVIFALHLAHPRVEYTDRGKSAIVLGGAA